ncbi:MAG: hypothetical protein AAFU71_09625, partial [Cyanobacteria bacterium J06632_22]
MVHLGLPPALPPSHASVEIVYQHVDAALKADSVKQSSEQASETVSGRVPERLLDRLLADVRPIEPQVLELAPAFSKQPASSEAVPESEVPSLGDPGPDPE